MTIAGNDPTGGAGLQADIETLASLGCHAAPITTALTIQDTKSLHSFDPVSDTLVHNQISTVLKDINVSVIKIGTIAGVSQVETIRHLLQDYPDIPVVMDPVLSAGGGGDFADEQLCQQMKSLLFPFVSILTPNSQEARRLGQNFNRNLNQGSDNLNNCAQQLIDRGIKYVLITGTHENTAAVNNRLYDANGVVEISTWERLPDSYHGSGCTLATAIAAHLALGCEPINAIRKAQKYTWQTLKHAYSIGQGQLIPNRMFQLFQSGRFNKGLDS